jgi:hemolysin III
MQVQNTDLRLKQEFVNSFLHGLGILFGMISIPILVYLAVKNNNTDHIIGTGVYGFSFLMVFTFSTLYHGFRKEKLKRTFKILDHISIYFLIAGTYTPLILIYQRNDFGTGLLIALWSLTLIGTVFKTFFCGRWDGLSTLIYVLMGWSMLAGGQTFFTSMPNDVLTMVITGGALYTIGVIFYVWEKYTYSHAVWHLFVLAAAICHYTAILFAI